MACTDADSNDLYYKWEFRYNISKYRRDIEPYTYSKPSKYIITLIVSDRKGSKSKSSMDIKVENVNQYNKPLTNFPYYSRYESTSIGYDFCTILEFCNKKD